MFWCRGFAPGKGRTLLGLFRPDTGAVELEDHGVVHDAIDGRCGGHRIFEDLVPL